jgi:hypothetical protein
MAMGYGIGAPSIAGLQPKGQAGGNAQMNGQMGGGLSLAGLLGGLGAMGGEDQPAPQGYAPFRPYVTPFMSAQTSAPESYSAPVQMLPENIRQILEQKQAPQSIYQNRGRLADMLSGSDYYGD